MDKVADKKSMINKLLLLLFTFPTLVLCSHAMAKDDTTNVLTIKTHHDESKSYKIKKIVKTRSSKDGAKVIQIHTYTDQMCEIDLDKVVSAPRIQYEGCTSCLGDDAQVERHYTQMFLNSSEPHISCDMHNGSLIGFTFLGGTTIDGESRFMRKDYALDIPMYEDEKFGTGPKPDAIDKVLDRVEKVLLKIFVETAK